MLPEGCVKKGIFFVSGEEPPESKGLARTWSHSSTPPRWGACRYLSLRGVAFLLEAWGLGWGVGRARICLVNGLNTFNCVLSSVQHPIHPITHQPFSSKAPCRAFSSFQLGEAVTLAGSQECGQKIHGQVLGYRRGGRPRRRSSGSFTSWEWGLGCWEVLWVGS